MADDNKNMVIYALLGLLGVGGGGTAIYKNVGTVDPTTQALTMEVALSEHTKIKEDFTRQVKGLREDFIRSEIERLKGNIRFYNDLKKRVGLTEEQQMLFDEKKDAKKRLEDDLHDLERTL